jgi:hypothetical protein
MAIMPTVKTQASMNGLPQQYRFIIPPLRGFQLYMASFTTIMSSLRDSISIRANPPNPRHPRAILNYPHSILNYPRSIPNHPRSILNYPCSIPNQPFKFS